MNSDTKKNILIAEREYKKIQEIVKKLFTDIDAYVVILTNKESSQIVFCGEIENVGDNYLYRLIGSKLEEQGIYAEAFRHENNVACVYSKSKIKLALIAKDANFDLMSKLVQETFVTITDIVLYVDTIII